MSALRSLGRLLHRIHRNEDGAVSLETILIVGAIALPILIFVLKFGWPKIRDYFLDNTNEIGDQSRKVINGT